MGSPSAARQRDGPRWPPFTVNDPQRVIALSIANATEVPVDYEHSTLTSAPAGRPAPAAGWVKKFEVRDTGIWGLVEWTAAAFTMIKAKEYRFISPTVMVDPQTRDVQRIANAGLTNMPALTLVPLTRNQSAMNELEQNAVALGLDTKSPLADILSGIATLRTKKPDPSEYVPLFMVRDMMASNATEQSAVQQERVKRLVEEAISCGRVTPAMKPWAMEYCTSNMEGFLQFTSSIPVIVAPGERTYPVLESSSFRSSREADENIARQLGIDPNSML